MSFTLVADCHECGLHKGFETPGERASWTINHKQLTEHHIDLDIEKWRD